MNVKGIEILYSDRMPIANASERPRLQQFDRYRQAKAPFTPGSGRPQLRCSRCSQHEEHNKQFEIRLSHQSPLRINVISFHSCVFPFSLRIFF